MKRALALSLLFALVAIGCQRKAGDGLAMNESVTDVGMPSGGYQAYPTDPQVAPQPVVYDSAQTPVQPGDPAAAATLGGGTYVVKKGDTLYGIARDRYGNGAQWTKIAEANPGLRPETLKAGQTINIP